MVLNPYIGIDPDLLPEEDIPESVREIMTRNSNDESRSSNKDPLPPLSQYYIKRSRKIVADSDVNIKSVYLHEGRNSSRVSSNRSSKESSYAEDNNIPKIKITNTEQTKLASIKDLEYIELQKIEAYEEEKN